MTENVRLNLHDEIAVVTIDRPKARNAIDALTAQQLCQTMDLIDANPDIRVAVLTGAGGNFCSGMDLKAFLRGEQVVTQGRGFAGIASRPPAVPIIAAVEGYALAGGFEIALACDLIVAAETAEFGLPEVSRGLMATAGGLVRLPRQLPRRIASELVLTGRRANARELAGYGMINRVTGEGQALDMALQLARSIAANAPLAVAKSRQVMEAAQDWASSEMFQRQDEMARVVFSSDDAREGARAFAEKRPPHWSGR